MGEVTEKIYCCDRGDNDNMKVIDAKMEAEMQLKREEVGDAQE